MKFPFILSIALTALVLFLSCKKDDESVTSTQPPIIENFDPLQGIVGSVVTITGKNFGTDKTVTSVKFNNVNSAINSLTDTQIKVAVPLGATTGKISVSVKHQSTISQKDFTIINEGPQITSFSPTSAEEGTEVIIKGSNFSSVASENIVKINDLRAEVVKATETELTIKVPAGFTTGKISVTVENNTAVSSEELSVRGILELISFTPTNGTERSEVDITGKNFSTLAAENIVKINGTKADVIDATSTQLTVKVPVGATTGKISVTVGSQTVTSTENFVVDQGPEISSFNPTTGGVGTEVTIIGNNFGATPEVNVVKFDGILATISSASPTQLVVIVPFGAVTGSITVIKDGFTSISDTEFVVIKDIPRNGLVALYPFNGNANDESGNNLNGTVDGPSLTTDRFGNTGNGYSFDGVDDVLNMGNPSLLQIKDNITVGMWIKIAAFSDNMGILSKMGSIGANKQGYSFELGQTGNGDQGYRTTIMSSSSGINWAAVGTFISNDWVFVAFTSSGPNYNFFQNGELTNSTDNYRELLDGSVGELTIGLANGSYFKGEIDDLVIYNRALSAAEIQQLYEQEVTQ